MPFLGTKQQDRCDEIHLKEKENLIKEQDLVSDVLCDCFTNIADGVKNKEELRKNDVDLMKHSMNYSNNVEKLKRYYNS